MTIILENTDIWTHGSMDLFVNNEPAHVYIPDTNVKQAYELLESRLSKEGSIPIGIDHLPDNIVEANPILAKLDLLNVGYITEIEYANDTITIVEAELTNPQIKALYEAGELDMVSIVATSNVSECPNDYDYIVNSTDITRVDIVEKGACPTCNIPKPHDDDTVVYARYSIKEEEIMAEELTAEAIKAMLDEALKPINEKLEKQDSAIKELQDAVSTEGDNAGETEETDEELEAKLAQMKTEAAEATVDMAIMAGKVTPAQRDAHVKICAADSEAYKEMMKDAPVVVSLDERKSLLAGASNDDDNDDEPDEDDKLLADVEAAFSKGE